MDEYPDFRSAAELRAGVLLWQIVSPVLLLFGTFGNVLSIIVLSRPRFRRYTSSVYLMGLSVADLCVLYVGLPRQWVRYTFDWDIKHASVFTCKAHWWLMYSSADCSVWILTAITIERLVSTLCPYKSKSVCTRNISKLTVAIIVMCALLINSHLLYGFDRLVVQESNSSVVISCNYGNVNYGTFYERVWTWFDLCKFSLVPFVILTFGNVCIIYKLTSSSRKVRSRPAVRTSQSSTAEGGHRDRMSSMSVLLISLNFVFIVCTAPVCIYFIGQSSWIPPDVPRHVQLQDPWWAVVNLLMYVNNSSNFVLYCLTGSRFRESVKQLLTFRRGTRVNVNNSVAGTNHTSTM